MSKNKRPSNKNNSKGLKYYPKHDIMVSMGVTLDLRAEKGGKAVNCKSNERGDQTKRILAFLRPCIKGPEDYALMVGTIGMSVNILRLIASL